MTDADARTADADQITAALRQLRLEHGNHPCYDAIEAAYEAQAQQVRQLAGALRAVEAVAADALLP
jgi:hypothetical protein